MLIYGNRDCNIGCLSENCTASSQFRCNSGQCLSHFDRCNMIKNCDDGSDEELCSCADFLRSQFLTRKLCDGIVDCWDHSDETNCGKFFFH